MAGQRRCKNCGAFLEENEKVCYICGEEQLPDVVVSTQPMVTEQQNKKITFEKDEDFVVPASSGNEGRTAFESRVPYNDEDIAEPYYKSDEKRIKAQKRRNKRALIIAIVCVAVAAVIGAVCFFVFGGFGGDKKADNTIKIYFDKPKSDIELERLDGKKFTWSDDVVVSYVINKKEMTKKCTPCEDLDSLWEVTLSVEAKSIYFYENGEKAVRTQVLPSFEEETVYYVSQEVFNSHDQLPLGQCARDSFEGIGINYATTAETSDSSSSSETTQETETEETTKPKKKNKNKNTEETTNATEADDSRKRVDNGTYTVDLPKSWQSGVTAVKNGNCTIYFEDYNHGMYNMGRLASVYVFDANDSAADNLTGVKDIRYNSNQKKKIVITTPTDIQFNEADTTAQKKYLEKNKDLNSFLDSISVE